MCNRRSVTRKLGNLKGGIVSGATARRLADRDRLHKTCACLQYK